MNITINLLEVASELAHNATIDELSELYNEDELWEVSDDEGGLTYIDDAQEVFNRWYNYYLNIIESFKID